MFKIFRKNTIFLITIFSATLALAASTVEACSVCVFAMVDRVLSPVLWWCLTAIVWFLTIAAIASARKEKVKNIPSFVRASFLVLVLIVIGLIYLGPLTVLPLFFPVLIVASRVFFRGSKANYSQPLRRDLKLVGGLGILTIIGLSTYSIYLQKTPSEYILKWENTYTTRSMLQTLPLKGASALPDLRIIVQKGSPSSVALAAQGLSKIGEPKTDVPLLINALTFISSGQNKENAASIEQALRDLSGISQAVDITKHLMS